MNFRDLSTLCLLWASTWMLVGCGGAPGTNDNNPGVAVQPGLYYAAVNNQDLWGVITPSAGGSRWYGLHYATTSPDVYSGSLTGTGSLQASVSPLQYQGTTDILRNGSATFTSSGAGQLSGYLSLVSNPSIQAVTFNAAAPSGFTFNRPALLSDMAGVWTGQLSYGSGTSANFGVDVASNGTVTARASGGGVEFANCKWTTFTATPDVNINLFALTLSMAASTGCDTDLNEKSLTGVAFVSPLAGNQHRLIWVATTTDGHAISFKGDASN